MEEDDESVAETILSSLDSSVDYNLDFENNTFALEDFIGQLEEETTELYNLLGSIYRAKIILYSKNYFDFLSILYGPLTRAKY